MAHALTPRRLSRPFGRRHSALVLPAVRWPTEGLPFFVRCWIGATAIILLWVG